MNVAARQTTVSAAQAYKASRTAPTQSIPINQLSMLAVASRQTSGIPCTPLTPPNSFADPSGSVAPPRRKHSIPHHHPPGLRHTTLLSSSFAGNTSPLRARYSGSDKTLHSRGQLRAHHGDSEKTIHGCLFEGVKCGNVEDGDLFGDQAQRGVRRESYHGVGSQLEELALQKRLGRSRNSSLTPVAASWDPAAALLRKYSWSGRHSASLSPTEIQSGLNTLEVEAISACQELSFSLKEIHISELLPRTPELVFINVTTVEGVAYCIELTQRGWRVCSLRHDSMNGDLDSLALHIVYFETPYAVLDKISPGYRREFGEALASRLAQEVQDREEHRTDAEDADTLMMAMDNAD